jgi:hypothetical protein
MYKGGLGEEMTMGMKNWDKEYNKERISAMIS